MACLDFPSTSQDFGRPATSRRCRQRASAPRPGSRAHHRRRRHKRRPPNLASRGLLCHPAHQRRRQHRLRNRCSRTTLTGLRAKTREAQRGHHEPNRHRPDPRRLAGTERTTRGALWRSKLTTSIKKRSDNAARTAPFTAQGHTQTARKMSSPGFVRPHRLPRPAWLRPGWPPGRA